MELRICIVVQNDYLTDGRVRRYAESLADCGAKVDILCVRGEENSADKSYRDDIRIYRIPLSHSPRSRIGYLVEYFLAVILFCIWLSGLYTKNRYQVIHINNMPDFLVFSGLIPRLFGAKLLLDIHDPMPEFYLSKFDHSKEGWPVKLLKFQERISTLFANAVITANDNFKQNLIARGVKADKITVVNNIADAKIFDRRLHPRRPSTQQDDSANRYFTLLYPGTLAPRYGLDLPIRAAVQLSQQIPNLRIQIFGGCNGHFDELKQLARDLSVEKHVEILPSVPLQEVPDLMASADLGFYTAYPDPHMSIATPTKVLEFVQMGLPVVAARLLILEQLFDDHSIRFFTPGSVDEFAAAVLELWASPESRQSLADRADQDFVSQQTWHREMSKYFALLNEMSNISLIAPASQHTPERTLDAVAKLN